MPDLDDRFRSLDGVKPPDLWKRIEGWEECEPLDSRPRKLAPPPRWRKITSVAATLTVAAAAIAFAVIAFQGSHAKPTPAASVGPPPSVSGVTADGTVRCTAGLESGSVEPGTPVVVDFTIENEGTEPLSFAIYPQPGDLTFALEDQAGHQLWGPEDVPTYEGTFPPPVEVAPGGSGHGTSEHPIQWNGPLTVAPTCSFRRGNRTERIELDPLPLDVTVPGPTPSGDEAVSGATAATLGLFDGCVPSSDGSAVSSELQVPGQPDVRLAARCWADIVPFSGFDRVTLHYVAPPDAPATQIPLDRFAPPQLPVTGPYETGQWTFVVTQEASREVDPLVSIGRSVGAEVDYGLRGGKWVLDGCGPGGGTFIDAGVSFPAERYHC